ncbi:LysR substrate-binding domain-containing protein [Georgenia yuyongxinii]|nr:LysR family transcriptional regulator [Georgenia yuyongxinii]
MELRHLRYFVTVVEERSFTRAAQRLLMTQPPLSTAVAQLEKEVGVPLLLRHARGIEPTDAGSHLAREARRLLSELDDAVGGARELGSGRSGRLTIATVAAATWKLLPEVLTAFAHRFPGVDIEVEDAQADDVIERVRHGRASVGIVYCASTDELRTTAAAGLQVARIHQEPLAAVLPRDHPAARGGVVDLRELGGDRWVVAAAQSSFGGLDLLVYQAWEGAGISPAWQRTSATAALTLVSAASFVTLLPWQAASTAGDGVHVAPTLQRVPPLEAAAVWQGPTPSPGVRMFLTELRATRWASPTG